MSYVVKIFRWLVILAILLVLGFVAYFFYASYHAQSIEQSYGVPEYLAQLLKTKAAGNNAAVLDQYQLIQNDPNRTPEEKALATIQNVGVEFSISGDASARIRDIQNLKAIAVDMRLSSTTRAAAFSILGNEYNASGKDPAVFAEVYKDAPFSTYLVPNQPELSAMNLERASYALYHSSTAAIFIAEFAAGQYFVDPQQSASTTAAYVAIAKDYVQKADAAILVDAARNPSYTVSDRYLVYRAARAITIGRLAIEKGEPYKSKYRSEFSNFFEFAQTKLSTFARGQVLVARFQFARILAADKDAVAEKTQLDLLAQDLNGLTNLNTQPFVLLLRNEHAYRLNGPTWIAMHAMFMVSPDFKAAAEKVINTTAR